MNEPLIVEANKEDMDIETIYQPITLGLTTPIDNEAPEGVYEGVKIQICQELLINASNQERISVIAHELGHLFGLTDYEERSDENNDGLFLGEYSLMSYGRDKTEITAPTVFDIRNILFIYG